MTKRAWQCGRARRRAACQHGRPKTSRCSTGPTKARSKPFDAAALAAGLRAVAPAMSTEQIRYYLCGAFLHSGRLVATDGHRLALKTVATNAPPSPDVIIPAPTVLRLLPLLRGVGGPLSVRVSPSQIIVAVSGWTLTSKLLEATFPDYSHVMPKRSEHPLLVRREALRSAAALVAKVAQDDKKNRGLRLVSGDGELLVENTGDASLGACHVTVPLEGEPRTDPQRVGLNPRYLLSALDVIDAEIVELHTSGPQHSIWLCAANEPHDGAVIMSMRV